MKTFRFQVLSPTWIMLVAAADGSRAFFVVYLITLQRTHAHTHRCTYSHSHGLYVNISTPPGKGGMMMLCTLHLNTFFQGTPQEGISPIYLVWVAGQRLLFFLSHLTRFVLVCTVTNSARTHPPR
uniref:Putative secreted protein n=1 Tax=Anopheles marajoara TaxID=58244 RepID=A0A2M4C6Z5_9DIPT